MSVNISSDTTREIKLFVSYAQLFLEKEIDIFDFLDKFCLKTIGYGIKDQVLVDESNLIVDKTVDKDVGSVEKSVKASKKKGKSKGKEEKKDDLSKSQGILIPIEPPEREPLLNEVVRIICCEGIITNNPKVKSLGPNLKARVLKSEDDLLEVRIVEDHFDPFVFKLPREDVELIGKN